MSSHLLSVTDAQWRRFLAANPHDMYHKPEYVALASRYEGGQPVAFFAETAEGALLLPLLIRDLPAFLGAPAAWRDVSSPYGYPGPLVSMELSAGALSSFLQELHNFARQNDLISAFCRFHPLINTDRETWAQAGELFFHGQTVVVDLSQTAEELWRQIRHDHREDISKLTRCGYSVSFDEWDDLDMFIVAYRETMKRASADAFYDFPDSYFFELRRELRDTLHLCTVHSPDGRFASSGLFSITGDIGEGHLAATRDAFCAGAPSKLLTHAQLLWAKSHGCRLYHLGGGVGAQADSLFQFKAGFSKLRRDFYTCRMVFDQDRYDWLTRRADGRGATRSCGYFPAYRVPGLSNNAGEFSRGTSPGVISLSRPDIDQSDIDAVTAVLRSGRLSLGPQLDEFERDFAEFLNARFGVAVSSGTAGLQTAWMAVGLQPGDEVITTPFSFVASAASVVYAGARPVFVDIDEGSLNIEASQIEAAIGERTRAVLPVHVFGRPCGMRAIMALAERYGLTVIEDACEALGARYEGTMAGRFGTASVFAFYPNKQMTTGEGGMIVTDDEEVARLCRSYRNQGRDEGAGWLAHARLGYNFRMSDIQAALGRSQLKRVPAFLRMRADVAARYGERLRDIPDIILPTPEGAGEERSWFVYVVRLADAWTGEDRDRILQQLRSRGIECSNYFPPIHLQPYFKNKFGYRRGAFPVTERVSARTIALPFHNHLSEGDIDRVARELRAAIEALSRNQRTAVSQV